MYRGNSGTSGNTGISAVHDDRLVRKVRENVLPGRKLIVCSPHTNKVYCWADFLKSFKQLPIDDAHVVLYDNSEDVRISARLAKLADSCRSVTLIRDENKPLIIDDVKDNWLLMQRCADVYAQMYGMIPKTAAKLIVNHEDDIRMPRGGVDRMLGLFDQYKQIDTAIVDCRCRRELLLGGGDAEPIICNFHRVDRIGGGVETRWEFERCKPKKFGIEAVGGGHMGFWVTRRECLERVGMKSQPLDELEMGHDFQYGMRVNETGGIFAVDWSVRAKHYCKVKGKKVAV